MFFCRHACPSTDASVQSVVGVDEFLREPFPTLEHQRIDDQFADCRAFLLFAGYATDFLDVGIRNIDSDFHTPMLTKCDSIVNPFAYFHHFGSSTNVRDTAVIANRGTVKSPTESGRTPPDCTTFPA